MNSCCTYAIEKIAANEHLQGGECCLITEKTHSPPMLDCPVSGTPSKKIQRRTLEHLLENNRKTAILNDQYYYCPHQTCDVVYFAAENQSVFLRDDVLVKVFDKDPGDEVNACYCFDWTQARIRKEISETGKSTAALQIAGEVKAGRCACDIKNPKGRCCLGDVNRVVNEILPRKIS